MWVNIDTRGQKIAPKSQRIAVGPENTHRVIARIGNPGSERVNDRYAECNVNAHANVPAPLGIDHPCL